MARASQTRPTNRCMGCELFTIPSGTGWVNHHTAASAAPAPASPNQCREVTEWNRPSFARTPSAKNNP